MLCIVLNAPYGTESWRMRRSVEVLGFHEQAREVHIQLGLYLENRYEQGPNYLRMLHRGNVECFLQPAWPFPSHPDEALSGESVLRDLYAPIFEDRGGTIMQVNTLTAWDSPVTYPTPQHAVAWGPQTGICVPGWGVPLVPEMNDSERASGRYYPFTSWSLGPFAEQTSYLITCSLRVSGATYDELVHSKPHFGVDGPERLLRRIRYDDLYRLPDDARGLWERELEPFEQSSITNGEGYDVIVLRSPLADSVERLRGSIGVAAAPKQPLRRDGQQVADRFITSDQAFSMTLRYAADQVSGAEAPQYEPALRS
jgi:hypothetical protein